jgi:hypothetical protein
MVCQLAPIPLPKGMGVPTLNDLQMGFEQKKDFLEKHLPRQIAIEERNLAEATSEQDRKFIQNKLDKLLSLQAKEQTKLLRLANSTTYNFLVDTRSEFPSPQLCQARQPHQLITEKGVSNYGSVF